MARKSRGGRPTKVLFVGNSFTARNDLPGLIARLAEARGRVVEHRLIHAGGAWQRFLRGHATPVLHDRDQSHPSVAGSYLAACVFLAALFRESPVGVDVDLPGLSVGDRAALQAAPWQAWESPA